MKNSRLVLCPFCRSEQRTSSIDNVIECIDCGELFEIDGCRETELPWRNDVL